MMNTTTSGSRRPISWVACAGQSKNPGVVSPLETRESKTGCTIPVLPAIVPRAGPREPARESPPIQSRSGESEVSGDRHADTAGVTGRVVGARRRADTRVPEPLSFQVPVAHRAPAVATTTVTTATGTITHHRLRVRRITAFVTLGTCAFKVAAAAPDPGPGTAL
jgi:hypothetical protein